VEGRALNSPIGNYKDLVAWQRGRSLVLLVYTFSNGLPKHEIFGLTSQMRRAATSIPLNVAEGYGLGTRDQFLKHLRYARASCMEVETAIDLASELYQLKPADQMLSLVAETGRVVHGLIRSLENKEG
jgi:four helix bundle protein